MNTVQIIVVTAGIVCLASLANWQGDSFGSGDIHRTAGVAIPLVAAYVTAIKTLGKKD